MALNWSTFRTRALTAIVFVLVMSVGLFWNAWSFFTLFTIVHFGAWFEFQKLTAAFNPFYAKIKPAHKILIPVGGWCLMLFFSNNALSIGHTSLSEIGLWGGILAMILLPVVMWLDTQFVFLRSVAYSFLGLIYISLPLGLLMELRTHWAQDSGSLSFTLPLLIIFSLWINDTMAYVVGSMIGRTPLSKVSPKKTWEGTAGGVVLTVVVISLLAYFTGRLPVVHAAITSALAAIVGTMGDLFESKLKRMAGVKDSGKIMPGHGGFLDRFDSLLFAVIAVWMYAAVVLE